MTGCNFKEVARLHDQGSSITAQPDTWGGALHDFEKPSHMTKGAEHSTTR